MTILKFLWEWTKKIFSYAIDVAIAIILLSRILSKFSGESNKEISNKQKHKDDQNVSEEKIKEIDKKEDMISKNISDSEEKTEDIKNEINDIVNEASEAKKDNIDPKIEAISESILTKWSDIWNE